MNSLFYEVTRSVTHLQRPERYPAVVALTKAHEAFTHFVGLLV